MAKPGAVIKLRSPLHALADGFREMVSGAKDGRPKWVDLIDEGDDLGLFGPQSAVWKVNGDIATILGGIRALILQAAHPAALAGVADHSRYESDLKGRLIGTSKWLTLTTFASRSVVAREAHRVNTMHKSVTGEFVNDHKSKVSYSASDPKFLLWVHCAFTDSFLQTYLATGKKCDGDAYVREWGASAVALGLLSAPSSMQELEEELTRFEETELLYTERTKEVLNFLLHPPLPLAGKLPYAIFAKAAIYTFRDEQLAALHLRRPSRLWLATAKVMLIALHKVLGEMSPAERAARNRAMRILGNS